MELKELEYFKAVVEEGSILKASTKLHISQPPLSRMMKQLEEELDTTLFIRGRRIVLTPTGKLLYEKACSMLSLKEDIIKEISSLEKRNEITLQLGIVSSSTNLLYSHALEDFHNQHQRVRLHLREANTYQLIELLNHKIIDLAVVRTPFNTEGFHTFFFEEEPMVVLCKENKLSSSLQLKDLSKQPLIIYRRFKEIIEKLFKENYLECNIISEVDDAKTAILLASTGLGYAIVPQSASKLFIHLKLHSSTLLCKELSTSLGIIFRKGDTLSPIYLSFIECLKNNEK